MRYTHGMVTRITLLAAALCVLDHGMVVVMVDHIGVGTFTGRAPYSAVVTEGETCRAINDLGTDVIDIAVPSAPVLIRHEATTR